MDAESLTVAKATGPSVAPAPGIALTKKKALASQRRSLALFCGESLLNAGPSECQYFYQRAAKEL